jgi:hypothetical protein
MIPPESPPPCSGETATFFAVDHDTVARAKAACGTCPLRRPCLERAVANREVDGVWGGFSFDVFRSRYGGAQAARRVTQLLVDLQQPGAA